MNRSLGVTVALLAVGVLLLQTLGFHDLRHDDAYITYRYSANLATGHGIVFNPGSDVMGSTSPGHVLLGAALYPFSTHASFPSLMSIIGCAAWTLQALLVFAALGEALGRRGAAFVAAAVAAGVAWSHRYVALETNLVAAACLAAVVLAQRDRWRSAAAAAALAGLLRPDALLLALPLGILAHRKSARGAMGPLFVGAALSTPWFAYAWIHFGSPLPLSAYAKVASEPALDYGLRAIRYVSSNLDLAPLQMTAASPAAWALSLGVLMLAIFGSVQLNSRCSTLAALPAFAGLLLCSYVATQPQPGMEWHLYPVLLIVSILALSGCAFAGQSAAVRVGRVPVSMAAVVVVALICARTVRYAGVHQSAYWYGARDETYRALAAHLDAHAADGDHVASSEVGTIAYYSGLPIVDIAGLVTTEAGRAEHVAACRWFVDVPAYSFLYGAPRAEPPYEVFESSTVSSVELQQPGETHFRAVLVERPR